MSKRKTYDAPLPLTGRWEFVRLVRCKLFHSASGSESEVWNDGPVKRLRTISWCLECGRPIDNSRVVNYRQGDPS